MIRVQRERRQEAPDAPVALVLPGAGYTVQAPLLYWPILALVRDGWDVWSINWHDDIDETVRKAPQGFVESALKRAEEALPRSPELVVAKSLGTFALPHFAMKQVRAAWLTPILTDPAVAKGLAAVPPGQHLAVGGTADPSWRPELAEGTSARLESSEAADHSLEQREKTWRKAADEQSRIIDLVVAHLIGS